MSSVAKFHVNFSLSIIVFCILLSNILIIANPDISPMNGASTFINLCSLGLMQYILLERMVLICSKS